MSSRGDAGTYLSQATSPVLFELDLQIRSMDKPNGQSRVRSLPGPVILCVLGAVCTFPCAYAQAQQSAAPGNDKDIDFTPQAGKVWSCTIDGCTSNPNIYTDQDIAAWDLKAADYAESCETFDYDYNTAFEDGFYAAVRAAEVSLRPSQLPGLSTIRAVGSPRDCAWWLAHIAIGSKCTSA